MFTLYIKSVILPILNAYRGVGVGEGVIFAYILNKRP